MKLVKMVIAALLIATPAFAQEAVAQVATVANSNGGLVAIAVGLIMALGVFGAAFAQAKVAAAALEGTARNPGANLFTMFILGLVFVETLVIFGFAVSFLLIGKI